MKNRPHILMAFRWYHPKLHSGVAQFAKAHGWHLNACMALDQQLPVGWKGDGILLQNSQEPQYVNFINSYDLPKVCLGKNSFTQFAVPTVCDDDRNIATLAVAHFRERGFRHFGWYGQQAVSWARHHLYADELEKFNQTYVDFSPLFREWTWQQRHDHAGRLLKKVEKPIAVFCNDDNSAAELLGAAMDVGLRVPEDVAVLGVRNDALICDTVAVPLSSIENSLVKVGYEAAQLLQLQFDGIEVPVKSLVVPPIEVVVRKSTDIVAVPHPNVSRALQYIHNTFQYPIKVAEITAAAGMSERGLFKAFKQQIGRTPGQEILRLRLKLARKKLVETDEKVVTIALECGFNDSRSLYAHFQKELQITPSKFRTKMKRSYGQLDAET